MCIRDSYETAQIAIGDNLLSLQCVKDFFRLNKGFVVKRGLPKKSQFNALVVLSHYIEKQIKGKSSIWIAQQEGRAKDGNDKTNPALIKMLYLSQRKSLVRFSEYINQLKIVPVSISYEYNPCDKLIAEELHRKSLSNGSYTKSKGEDERSMLIGIIGEKGKVHISFGTQLSGNFSCEEDVAVEIDRQIISNYKLWDTNYIAFEKLFPNECYVNRKIPLHIRKKFLSRIRKAPKDLQRYMLMMYANPVVNKKKLNELNI